ncbi:hypothetical protein C8F04DRAFT_1145794 [Mycena alexandri]|uniref:F-box domain-containing protein n=1 Tax=Mycena alexandri TaxID=1745969 RepID=A0AAD6S345_9AGAR|nr:hypothetical protein C8F04DRAFT_1145794 [Mycena alexandri]
MPARGTPPEILDLIIENYANDAKTLFSCSLVSKAWLHSTRYHIFGDLTIHLGGAYEATFLALLRHPLCTFSTSVRKIWILPAQERDLSKQVNDNIAQLAQLTSVRTLRIHRQRTIHPPTLTALSAAFKDITTLVIMVRFPTLSDAIRFMCSSFPLLEEVVFEPVRTQPGEFPSAGIPMPPRLRSLHLHTLRSHERWFADNRVSTLSTLSVETIRPFDDMDRLDEMLEIFEIGIRHLTLRFASQKGDFDIQVNLAHTTQLRYLEIDLSKLTRRHVVHALASLRAPHLETLVWRTRRPFDFPAELWSTLDTLLANRDMLPTLNRFLVLAPVPSKVTFNPRFCMPLCDALGILSGGGIIINV